MILCKWSLTSGKMAVTAARAAAPRTVHDGGQTVWTESDHAVDVETIRVWRTA